MGKVEPESLSHSLSFLCLMPWCSLMLSPHAHTCTQMSRSESKSREDADFWSHVVLIHLTKKLLKKNQQTEREDGFLCCLLSFLLATMTVVAGHLAVKYLHKSLLEKKALFSNKAHWTDKHLHLLDQQDVSLLTL